MKKKNIIIILVIVAILIGGLSTYILISKNNSNKKESSKNHKEETYTMYVKINPLVKLTFKRTYEMCEDEKGNSSLCGGVDNEIIDYELVNDDAKDIYKDLDFKGKSIEDVLVTLCDVARDNKIGFKSLEITSDDKTLDDKDLSDYVKEHSKYTDEVEVYVNFEEYLNEDEIVDEKDESSNQSVSYIVKFDTDGGSAISAVTVKENEALKEPTKPTKKGYTFVEWQLNGQKYDFSSKVKQNMTLKALWKKEDTSKPTTSNSNTSNKPTENTPKITSTLSKINLNENILVQEMYYGTYCGYKFFPTNLETLFPNKVDKKNISLCENASDYEGCVAFSEYENKESQIKYDASKEEATSAALKTISKKKIRGVTDFSYSFSDHKFKYEFEGLDVYYENEKLFKNLSDGLKNELQQIYNLFKNSYSVYGACGTSPEPPTLLDEALCKKYNLTCDRW